MKHDEECDRCGNTIDRTKNSYYDIQDRSGKSAQVLCKNCFELKKENNIKN